MAAGSEDRFEAPKDNLQFKRDIYIYVKEITGSLTEGDEQDMSERLEEEYGLEMYPINIDDAVSSLDYINAGFALSSLLAGEYSTPQGIFFSKREEGFREMIEEKEDDERRYKKPELIQHARLYSKIADEEDIQLDYSPEQLLLKNLDEVRGSVRAMLQDFNEGL